MDVQAAPSPYTPVGGTHSQQGNPPVLGSQTPGNSGGLPSLSGLSSSANPMAEQLQSMGRGDDSVLIHMTPDEVNSLQGLAMAAGGSLTINPKTGLPEAGWLGRLLPTILGVAGAAFGLPTWAMGLGVGAGKAALTGDLSKGLMAGLEAFGGAGLGQAAGLGGAISNNALGMMGGQAASAAGSALASGASGLGAAVPASVAPSGSAALGQAASKAPGFLGKFANATSLGQTGMLGKSLPMLAGGSVLGAVSDATAPTMPTPEEDKTTPYVPMGPGKREVRFQTPEQMRQSGGAEFSYFTPSNPDPVPLYGQRGYAEGGEVGSQPQDFNSLVAMYQSQNPGAITASMYPTPSAPSAGVLPPVGGETMHNFNQSAPRSPFPAPQAGVGGEVLPNLGLSPSLVRKLTSKNRGTSMGIFPGGSSIRNESDYAQMNQYADGGAVRMDNGSFVVDARTVSELGNGSSNAGIEMLSRMGGRPVRGPGDGVSDSVKASIGGTQEARVARDEVIFSPEAVKRLGGGSDKRGTQKLYAMMDKAHNARKKAKRGQDTGLRRGLA